jgi:hypothetical protein
MSELDQETSRQNADQAAYTFRFFLIYPFVAGALFTLVVFAFGILKVVFDDLSEGRPIELDLVRGAFGMLPVYLILVAAIFLGEVAYMICRKLR